VLAAVVGSIAFFLRHHNVGAWVPVAVGLPLLVLVPTACFVGRRSRGAVIAVPTNGSGARVEVLEKTVADVEYQKRLLWDALESIQQALASDADWELDDLVERGVLGPARGLLVRDREEDVRLAVMVPADDPPTRFRMRWAAGHRPESVRLYEREIDKTLAGIAFRRDEFVECPNVREDARFEPNPKETRPFVSLVSMPLRIDQAIVGAFTVVSTREAAFTQADTSFIKLIGALLDVRLAAEHDILRWAAVTEAIEQAGRRAIAPRDDRPADAPPEQDEGGET
jgi:hypothetical protein